jgi:hypothetical protein
MTPPPKGLSTVSFSWLGLLNTALSENYDFVMTSMKHCVTFNFVLGGFE